MVEGTDLLELYVAELKKNADNVVFSFIGKSLHDCMVKYTK